jgi:MYXO-CTERM domain-containing protein
MKLRTLRPLIVVAALATSACAPSPAENAHAVAQGARTLGAAIDLASARFGVPREILLALSHAETSWAAPSAQDEHAGEPGSLHAPAELGPTNLRHGAGYDSLGRALSLLQVDESSLRASLGLQVAGAAAVLAELGARTGARRDDVDSWARAVAQYSGLVGETVQADYAEGVWHRLRTGLRDVTFTGETLELAPRNAPPVRVLLDLGVSAQASTDYGPARWVAANAGNYTAGRSGGARPAYVVIHTMQGSYAGTVSWFQNPAAMASCHYNIRASDGEVTQMVRESDTAWHTGNWSYNQRSIGIEHEGFVADPARWYTSAMYISSARLTRALCDRYGIPIDREHIIGHYQIPTSGSGAPCPTTATGCGGAGRHTDPGNGGAGWDWNRFIELVRNNGMPGPMVPAYNATLVGSSYPMDAVSGTRPVAWVEYRNTGSSPWDIMGTRIGTTGPRDRASRFFDMVNWVNPTRPSGVDMATAPGAVGRFSFVLNIPTVETETVFTESFGLVQEGRTWFGPADDAVTFRIRVRPASGDAGGVPTATDAATPRDATPPRPVEDAAAPPPVEDAAAPPLPADDAEVPIEPEPPVMADAGRAPRDASPLRPPPAAPGCGCSAVGPTDARPALGALTLLAAAVTRRRRASRR